MPRLWLKRSFDNLSLAVQFAAEGWWCMQPKEHNHRSDRSELFLFFWGKKTDAL
jgi:hypothetical protein